jgi:cytochrome P450
MSEHPEYSYPSPTPRSLQLDPVLDEVRKAAGVARVTLPYGDPCWLVTGYDDARSVYSKKCFGRPGMEQESAPRLTAGLLLQGAIGSEEDSVHLKLRRTLLRELSADRISALRSRAELIMADLLDSAAKAGSSDYVSTVARPFAIQVLCELLGVPSSYRSRLSSWVRALLSDASTADRGASDADIAMKDLGRYIVGLIRERRTEPGEDLVSALAAPTSGLDTRETATLIFALTMGGFETTAHMLSKMVLRLLSTPDSWKVLCAQPESVAAAVEELLRTIAIAGGEGIPWVVREPVRLAGVEMAPGDYVVPAVGAANLDPQVFSTPDELRFDRGANPHLTFGHGAHYCLGSEVARLELQVGLGILVQEFPDAELAIPPDDIAWRSGTTIWELAELPIRLRGEQ